MGENGAEPTQQSFLSKLRKRSAIIFTIGLAISVASFVENLHMGKTAIAFVVDELSKIQGWEDIVRAAAAMLHGVLEWWRGVLRDLFSFLPFEVPQWLHDSLSVVFFGAARVWNAENTASAWQEWKRRNEPDPDGVLRPVPRAVAHAFPVSLLHSTVSLVSLLLVFPMTITLLIDRWYFQSHSVFDAHPILRPRTHLDAWLDRTMASP